VFVDKAGMHAIAMQAGTVAEEAVPGTAREPAFRRAFELTEKLLGQSATIATHDLRGVTLPTVDDGLWVEAAAAGTP
jgi:hypothetical protein